MSASLPDTSTIISDEELVRLIQKGESHRFGELMRRHLRGAVAVGLEYARDLDEAEDIAQDAFHRLWSSIARFDPAQRFRPWFYTIVRNLGRNVASKRARRGEVELHDSFRDRDGDSDSDREIRNAIESELAKMSEMQAGCFRLCEMEGFTSEEVADMMDIEAPTVRTHCFRARAKLRVALEKYGLS
ncbi:MAG TPA: RNA polymerase sigma factor [Longimicrobiales bacterium]|nr:RNA polymerase sigma factor [Longimicrobiales bacterium]